MMYYFRKYVLFIIFSHVYYFLKEDSRTQNITQFRSNRRLNNTLEAGTSVFQTDEFY